MIWRISPRRLVLRVPAERTSYVFVHSLSNSSAHTPTMELLAAAFYLTGPLLALEVSTTGPPTAVPPM